MRDSRLVADRYRLEQRIAAGGMGEVWRGFDTRLDRPVAIKLLHSGMSGNARFRARFQAEAKSVAALQAPGVVAMYDYGEEETAEGLESYLVMELVDGEPLDELVRQHGRISYRDTMRLTAEAAEALDAAHRAGIVHRDVKPGNILMDREQRIKIVDFGIARARGEAGLTETGMVMGTVAYTSPEQLCDHELTAATDVYSLAVVAYECLTGATPFASENPGAVINGHMNQPPPPMPSDVPPEVAQVIEKALAKNPQDRWESAAQFAQACREASSGGGTTAVLAAQPAATTRMMPRDTQPTSRVSPEPPPPPREPMPPPRPAEEPEKKSKALPILATLAILAVAAAAIVLWSPWNNGDNANANSGDDESSQTSQESSDEENENTPTEEETLEEETSEEPTENEPTQDPGTSEEEQMLTVPPVVGMHIDDAMAEMQQAGFTNVDVQPSNENPEGSCEVRRLDPAAETQVPPDEAVMVMYEQNIEECPESQYQ